MIHRPSLPTWLVLLIALFATACAGGTASKPPPVENPYAESARLFINGGMIAMQDERWLLAEREFSQALLSAQLADDLQLIGQCWYNLGSARGALGQRRKAETAFQRAIEVARQQADPLLGMRARLALTMIRLRAGEQADNSDMQRILTGSWPTDIYLQAARIAQLQQLPEQAKSAYEAALGGRGETRSAMKMRAEAHMGLALLARSAGKKDEAHRQADMALAICHEIGAARLTAHALLLKGQLPPPAAGDQRQSQLARALDIYSALGDRDGQRQSLQQLHQLAESAGDSDAMQRIELRLKDLDAKLVE